MSSVLLAFAFVAANPNSAVSAIVTDVETGISVAIDVDARTLAAKDKDGKPLWKVDAVAAAGTPLIGEPRVRELMLRGTAVQAVVGKHCVVTVDLKSGKVIAVNCD